MEAELLKELDKTDEKAVRQLVEECNAYDHTAYDSDLDGDFYYLVRNDDPEESGVDSPLFAILSGYKLGETIDGQDVLEIEAFTTPVMRGIGMFTMCYQSLLDDFRGYRIRFMLKRPVTPFAIEGAEPPSQSTSSDANASVPDIAPALPFVCPDAYETLSAIGAIHQYDELLMQKELPRPIKNPGEQLSTKFGELHTTPYDKETLYVYGVLVYEKYQHAGHGRELMQALETTPDGHYRKLLLQVSSTNLPALHLYQTMGYQETERILYFLNKT